MKENNSLLPAEKLRQKLNELSVEGQNLQSLKEYLGEDNLTRLPFAKVTLQDGSNSWDGNWVIEVNLTTGYAHSYCSVADGEDILLTGSHLKRIEEEIYKTLDKK